MNRLNTPNRFEYDNKKATDIMQNACCSTFNLIV